MKAKTGKSERSATGYPVQLRSRWVPAVMIVILVHAEIGGAFATVDLGRYESVQNRPGQDSDIAVALVLSGGGSRVANFSIGVLEALAASQIEGRSRDLLAECDYIVSHSSGGCAAATYLVSLDDYTKRHGTGRGYSFEEALDDSRLGGRNRTLKQALSANYFKPIIFGLGRDLVPRGSTRGEQLERFLDKNILGDLQFSDVFVEKGSGRTPHLPYWFPYSTIHGNGATFVHAPDVYRSFGITSYRQGRRKRQVDGDFGAIPCSVALRASMSFPILVPPCVFESSIDPDKPYIHLRDGGMADNVGTHPALSILRQEKAKRKLMVVVDGNRTPPGPYSDKRSTGGLFTQMYLIACLPLDARLHRYRQNGVSREVRRDPRGKILCGTTADGIRVVFLYPELLPEETGVAFNNVGTTLKLKDGEQELLIRAGRQIVEVQRKAIAWGLGNPASGKAVALVPPITSMVPENSQPTSERKLLRPFRNFGRGGFRRSIGGVRAR